MNCSDFLNFFCLQADVLIANPNPLFHHQPYVVQNGRCGLPGSYIHITPEFLMNSEIVQDFGDKRENVLRLNNRFAK